MHWIMVWSSRCFSNCSLLVPSSTFKNIYVSRSFQSFTRVEPSLFRVFLLCTEFFRHFNTDFITKYICMFFFYANIPQTPVDSVANFFLLQIFFYIMYLVFKKKNMFWNEWKRNSIHKKNWSTWSNIYFGEHFFPLIFLCNFHSFIWMLVFFSMLISFVHNTYFFYAVDLSFSL